MNELFSLYGDKILSDNYNRHYDVKYADTIEMCNPNDVYYAISPTSTKYDIKPTRKYCSNRDKKINYIVNLIDGTVLGYVENSIAYIPRGVTPFLRIYIPDDDIIFERSSVGEIPFVFNPTNKFGVTKHINHPLLCFKSQESQMFIHHNSLWLNNVKSFCNELAVGIGDIMIMEPKMWHYVLYHNINITNTDTERLIKMFNNPVHNVNVNVKPHPAVKHITISGGKIIVDIKATIEVLRAYSDKLYYIKLVKPLTLDLQLQSTLRDIETWQVTGDIHDHPNIINEQICLGNVSPSIDSLDDIIRTINDIVTLVEYPNLDNSLYGNIFLKRLKKEGYVTTLPNNIARRYEVEQ